MIEDENVGNFGRNGKYLASMLEREVNAQHDQAVSQADDTEPLSKQSSSPRVHKPQNQVRGRGGMGSIIANISPYDLNVAVAAATPNCTCIVASVDDIP